jgi:hypothetical protein
MAHPTSASKASTEISWAVAFFMDWTFIWTSFVQVKKSGSKALPLGSLLKKAKTAISSDSGG